MGLLQKELFGAWRLLSYIEIPINGGDSYFPYGKSPKGILLYNPEGFMSLHISASEEIQLLTEGHQLDRDENTRRGTPAFVAFSGAYTVDSKLACVNYFIETALYPAWEGTKQVRKLSFEGNTLYQKTMEPVMSEGEMVHAHMTWERVDQEQGEEILLTKIGHDLSLSYPAFLKEE
ncbi:lipocalin-like domain-containing protein [Sphingobacterium sp. SGG-5]|uniref:lipocalin-like domain-containing protein n=1 Tax=Sphingobacterium sp. SGG-5 TaxID=2710881 RepID=UPI0013ED6CC6|nr:lipocalin-like domain-containing protein [Sphingobacterium sp. SGG-5]NGM61423.1 lipocalin-like domain-containing protein [Sphingobacterium sp. SGG-5]